jgi:tetratricopeptide (TPR) repeat protein
MKLAKVMGLGEEGKSHYLSADYRSSILKSTEAISAFESDCMEEPTRDFLAVLLSDRAAGLLMVGAFRAAADDCKKALEFVSDPATYVTSSESGPTVLQSKLYTLMARALLKLGDADAAKLAFNESIDTAIKALELCEQQDSMLYEGAQIEATLGNSEVAGFLDSKERILACTQSSVHVGRSSERKMNLEALGHVNMALSKATGCDLLHKNKVTLLARLNRWRAVASHCERLAATNTKLDGCFREDLASKHPYLGVPPAKHLTPDYFGDSEEDQLQGAERILKPEAAAEAVLRIPDSMRLCYIRSLRLEERLPAAEAAIRALERVAIDGQLGLRRQKDRLHRTISGREKGKELYRKGHLERALAEYTACLLIDSEGSMTGMYDSSAGGRLHAVLHYSRAACFMGLQLFREALTDYTAALRIHSGYMTALRRRARCYRHLDWLEESVADYKWWLEMVERARDDQQNVSFLITANEVSQDKIKKVKRELDKSLAAKSAEARSEAADRQQREKWLSANDSQQAEAQRRSDREPMDGVDRSENNDDDDDDDDDDDASSVLEMASANDLQQAEAQRSRDREPLDGAERSENNDDVDSSVLEMASANDSQQAEAQRLRYREPLDGAERSENNHDDDDNDDDGGDDDGGDFIVGGIF